MKLKELIRGRLIAIHKSIFKNHYYSLLKLLEPNCFKFTKKGFGRKGDGTYILPKELLENTKDTVLLSFGICNDISFEKAFQQECSCKIYAFDPTIERLPEDNQSIQFFRLGLAGKLHKEKSLLTLPEIIDKLGLNRKSRIILKIDIEGWEWGFFQTMDFSKFDIQIIALELHFLPLLGKQETLFLPILFYKKYRILKKVLNSFYVFHVHANNYQYINFRNFDFPTYLELTLINKKVFLEDIQKDVRELNSPTILEKIDIQFPFIK
jgi:hypothetical protein